MIVTRKAMDTINNNVLVKQQQKNKKNLKNTKFPVKTIPTSNIIKSVPKK